MKKFLSVFLCAAVMFFAVVPTFADCYDTHDVQRDVDGFTTDLVTTYCSVETPYDEYQLALQNDTTGEQQLPILWWEVANPEPLALARFVPWGWTLVAALYIGTVYYLQYRYDHSCTVICNGSGCSGCW